MDLPLTWLDLLNRKASEEIQKEHIRDQWTAMLPFMAANILKYMSFSDYYDQVSGKNFDLRPDSEILEEVQMIRKEIEG